MKKLILFLLIAVTGSIVVPTLIQSNEAQAQIVTSVKPTAADDTLVNTDTAIIYVAATQASAISGTSATDNITRSVEAHIERLSGTAAGSVSFEGTIDGTNYEVISTYTITNTATQIKTFMIRNANGDYQYKTYRLVFYPTGTNSIVPKAYVHRRSN